MEYTSFKDFKLPYLTNILEMAVEVEAKYIAVMIEFEGLDAPEIIINPIENALEKIEYYKNTYDYNLNHRYSKGIRIVNASYGDNFGVIEYELLGL